jgi:nitrous oxidase accessory protein NosD
MKLTRVQILTLVLASAALIGASAATASATVGGPVCNVPTDYSTIQAAVSEPGCTTVNVAAGTYHEQVEITKKLTLNGAQQGVDARTRSGGPSTESIITDACGPVVVKADEVTINGFTIEGATGSEPTCFHAGIWTNPGFYGGQGGTQILDNIIQDNTEGIYLNNGTIPAKVQNNLIQNNNNPGPSEGDGIYSEFIANALVESNEFTGDAEASMVAIGGGAAHNITVSNNQLVGSGHESIDFIGVADSTISGNTSIGSTASTTIDLFGEDTAITVDGNILANGVRGIQVEDPFGVAPNAAITANRNCIQGNTAAGLEEDAGGYVPLPNSLDATNNWWGSPSGPTIASNPGGTGDKIIDQDGVISYKPFATTAPAGCPAPPCPPGTTANFRWHYSANGSAGSWSVTKSVKCPGSLTMGPQAMEGDLKVSPGATLKVGYDFSLPGNKSHVSLKVSNPQVVFTVRCASGATPSASTLTVPMPNASYAATNSEWIPSGNQQSPLVFQGSITVPDLCSGGKVRLDKGGTFSASVS